MLDFNIYTNKMLFCFHIFQMYLYMQTLRCLFWCCSTIWTPISDSLDNNEFYWKKNKIKNDAQMW